MARKPAVSTENTQETTAAEPKARVAKPRTVTAAAPRVKAARHVKAAGFAENVPAESVAAVREENADEVIARMAYSYWEARGGEDGNAVEDWLRAEQDYRARAAS